jgi:predicted ATPase
MQPVVLGAIDAIKFKNLIFGNPFEFYGLNIFIGPNTSGKSNFISILKFLNGCMKNSENSDSTSFDQSIRLIGSNKIADIFLDKPCLTDLKYFFKLNFVHYDAILYHINLIIPDTTFTEIRINYESLVGLPFTKYIEYFFCHYDVKGNGILSEYYRQDNKRIIKKIYNIKTNATVLYDLPNIDQIVNIGTYLESNNILDSRNSEYGPLSESKLLEYLNEYRTISMPKGSLSKKSLIDHDQASIHQVRRSLLGYIGAWKFYNCNELNPKELKFAEPRLGLGEMFLAEDCMNLARVFHNLCQEHVDFEDDLNLALRQALPRSKKVRARLSGVHHLHVEWHFEGAQEPLWLSDMSDGSVRMLCLAIMLLSPKPPSLLVIDEPELGIHPAWMPILAGWIKKAAERTTVIISTHSPDLLDHFTDTLESTVCFSRVDQHHYTPVRLSREKLKPRLDEGWQLGDLYRVGDPDVGGWPW